MWSQTTYIQIISNAYSEYKDLDQNLEQLNRSLLRLGPGNRHFAKLFKWIDSQWNSTAPNPRNPFPLQGSAAAGKSRQSCPTLCDPIDGSLPGSPVHGILQARVLEWVAISFSRAQSGAGRGGVVVVVFNKHSKEGPCSERGRVFLSFRCLSADALLLLLSHFSRVRLYVIP